MKFILLLLLAGLPFAFGGVEPWAVALSETVVFLIAARLAWTQTSVAKKLLLPVGVLLFVAFFALAQTAVQQPVSAAAGWLPFTSWRPATLYACGRWLMFACLVWAAPSLLNSKASVKTLFWLLLCTGVVISLMGMFQRSTGDFLIYGLRYVPTEPFGPFVNRDNAANFLALCAMCGVGLWLCGLAELVRHEGGTHFWDRLAFQFFMTVLIAICAAGIIKSGSRGALHAFFAALAVVSGVYLFSLRGKKRVLLAVSLALAVAGYGAFLASHTSYLGRPGGKLDASTAVRLSLYKSTAVLIKDFPLFGTGLGSFRNSFGSYQAPSVRGTVEYAHCDWLQAAAETGLPLAMLFAGMVLYILYRTARHCARENSSTARALGCGILGALTAFCLHACVDFPLQIPANAVLFFSLLGLAAARVYSDVPKEELLPRMKFVRLPLFALCLACWIPAIGWAYGQAGRHAERLYQPDYFRKALSFYPDPDTVFRLGAAQYNIAVENQSSEREILLYMLGDMQPYFLALPDDRQLRGLRQSVYLRLGLQDTRL